MKPASPEPYTKAVKRAFGKADSDGPDIEPDKDPDDVRVKAHSRKKPKHSKKHPGFKAVASKIAAKENVSQSEASAMLAASSRAASAKAKAANPRLKRVRG